MNIMFKLNRGKEGLRIEWLHTISKILITT